MDDIKYYTDACVYNLLSSQILFIKYVHMYDCDVMLLVSVLDTSNSRCDIGILSSLVLCHHCYTLFMYCTQYSITFLFTQLLNQNLGTKQDIRRITNNLLPSQFSYN